MKKMKAGIVGAGFIGEAHIEALRRLGFVEAAAIVSPSGGQKKANALSVPRGYTDYREMIDCENLDAVHICTPNHLHHEIAMYAMKKGLAVVCEKPMTVTLAEARELRDFAKEHGIVNCVNFSLRMYPQVAQMKEMVQKGDIGRIYSVHGAYLQDWLFYDTDWSWRLESALSGKTRAFSDIGSHWIDMVENIMQSKAVEVLAEFETFHKTRKKPLKETATYSGMARRSEDYEETPVDTEDFCAVLFRFDNGAVGSCTISQACAGRKNQQILSFAGSKSSLYWDSEDSNDMWVGHRDRYNERVPKDPSILYDGAKAVVDYPGGHVEGYADTFKQNFKKFYGALTGGVAVNGEFATFEDGYREMLLNEKVYESAQKRAWVKVED